MANSRIIVAVSSPWASEKIFEVIRDLAQRLKASVVIAHVMQTQEVDESDDDARKRSEQTISMLTSQLQENDISAEGMLLFGDDVARAIVNAAEAQNATMIIIGASGKGRVAKLLAGNVPHHVVMGANVPVMLIPTEWSGVV